MESRASERRGGVRRLKVSTYESKGSDLGGKSGRGLCDESVSRLTRLCRLPGGTHTNFSTSGPDTRRAIVSARLVCRSQLPSFPASPKVDDLDLIRAQTGQLEVSSVACAGREGPLTSVGSILGATGRGENGRGQHFGVGPRLRSFARTCEFGGWVGRRAISGGTALGASQARKKNSW